MIIKRIVLPYTGRITSQVSSIIRRRKFLEMEFIPVNKISKSLPNNNKLSADRIGVYKFPCHVCTMYMSETGGDLKVRAAEKVRNIRNSKDKTESFCHMRDNTPFFS